MILYNIGEVTDRTIHYFSLITLRGRRTTHAYSLLPPSHIRVHIHSYTHIHTRIQTFVLIYVYNRSPIIIPFILLQSLSHFRESTKPPEPFLISRQLAVAASRPAISRSAFRTSSIRIWRLTRVRTN